MRSPFRSFVVIDSTVVASPSFSSIGSGIASSLVMLLNIVCDSLDVVIIPYRSPVDAFNRDASDGSVGLDASGGS